MSDEDIFMQELENDSEYVAWCEQHKQELIEEMLAKSEEELNKIFNMQHKYLVFVYGSLKRGFGNHGFLENSKFLGITDTVHRVYRMYPLFGSFPTVVATNDEAYAITGELYEVDYDTLKRLDILEGDGHMYTRRLTSVHNGSDTVEAWMYMMPEDDRLIRDNVAYPSKRFVYTDSKLGTQEWFQE